MIWFERIVHSSFFYLKYLVCRYTLNFLLSWVSAFRFTWHLTFCKKFHRLYFTLQTEYMDNISWDCLKYTNSTTKKYQVLNFYLCDICLAISEFQPNCKLWFINQTPGSSCCQRDKAGGQGNQIFSLFIYLPLYTCDMSN